MKKLPLYFAVFCFGMAFFIAYNSGQRGLLSVILFFAMGIIAVLKVKENKKEQ